MQQRSLWGGKGHQGPHMDTGTSREMFLQQCRGAWVHGSIATDGFDPSAVCGGPHEVFSRVRNRAVMVDHTVLPGLLGGAEWAREENSDKRNYRERNDDNDTRYDDDLIVVTHSNTLEHPHNTRTREYTDALNSRPWNARRGV